MKHTFTAIAFLFTSFSASFAQSPPIQRFVSAPGLEHALVGICIKDMDGKSLYGYNQDKLLTPGSIMKVVTTASALEMLGDDFRYSTKLSFADGDSATLVVTGSGDPTLGSEFAGEKVRNFLPDWSSKVNAQKESEHPFRILVDDSLFGYEGISAQWMWEDMGNYYAAGAYGISVFDNMYRMTFNTLQPDNKPALVQLEPSIPGLTFENNLKTNTTGQDNSFIHGITFSTDRRITGSIPGGKASFTIKGDIPDPGLFLAKSLTDEIRFDGMRVVSYETFRTHPFHFNHLRTFYEHTSPQLKDVVRQVNVRSNNHYAEHLIRTIGVLKKGSLHQANALKDGIAAVHAYWKSKDLDSTSLLMYDGCGLSPQDAVTPEFMTDVLVKMQQGKNDKSFRESLPKAGEEGTVRNFLKDTHLAGNVWAKSGSISDVQCFAGYFIKGGQKYAFTVMVNKFTGSRHHVVKNIEDFLLSVF